MADGRLHGFAQRSRDASRLGSLAGSDRRFARRFALASQTAVLSSRWHSTRRGGIPALIGDPGGSALSDISSPKGDFR